MGVPIPRVQVKNAVGLAFLLASTLTACWTGESEADSGVARDAPPEVRQPYREARRLYFRGDFAEAARLFRQAYEISKKLGRPHTMARKYEALCYQYQDDYATAGRLFNEAYELENTLDGELDSLNNLGWLAYLKGDLEEALRYLQRAEALLPEYRKSAKERGPGSLYHSVQINLGIVHKEMGHYALALKCFHEPLRYVDLDRHGMNETRLFRQLGDLELLWGDSEKAFEHYERSVAAADKAYDSPYNRAYYVDALVDLARSYAQEKKYARAVERLEEALSVSHALGTRRLAARALAALGEAHRRWGRLDKAVHYHQQALESIRGLRLRVPEAQILASLGHDFVQLGRYQKAALLFRSALQSLPAGLSKSLEASIYLGLAQSSEGLDDLPGAAEQYNRLIDSIEDVDIRLVAEEDRVQYWSTRHWVYERMVALLVRLGQIEKAFHYAERGRAKVLVDLMLQTGTRGTAAPSARERAVVAHISRLQSRLLKVEDSAQEQRLLHLLDQARTELSEARLAGPWSNEGMGLKTPAASIKDIQRKLRGSNDVLIEFLLSEPQSFVWVVTRHDVRLFQIAGRSELADAVTALRRRITDLPFGGDAFRSYFEKGHLVFRLLCGAFKDVLLDAGQITVIPDGILFKLPFEALLTGIPDNSGDLPRSALASKGIAYGLSASLWSVSDPKESQEQLVDILSVAYSGALIEEGESFSLSQRFRPLANVEEEARTVAQSFPSSEALVGKEATESSFVALPLARYRMIHFAAHAYVDNDDPGTSGLLLDAGGGEDGYLRVEEISRLRLNADLVTLSACETGLGKLVAGEGLMNLARAFFVAGARNVVVSLWKTDDEASVRFMKTFYHQLAESRSPPEALQAVRQEFLQSNIPAYRFPYFWAPFVVFSR